MPRSIRLLASFLIGLPGAMMWIGSMVTLAVGLSLHSAGADIKREEMLITIGISLGFGLVGFSMTSAVEFLNGARRYRMPGHRIFPYLCLRLLEQVLAVTFAGLLLATMVTAASNHYSHLAVRAISTGVALVGLVAAVRWQSHLGEKWRQERPDEPPAPDFS